MKKLIIIAVIIALGAYLASPYFALYNLKSAITSDDADKLSESVDFEALRKNIKDIVMAQASEVIAEELDDNPFASLGAALGGVVIEGVVNAMITPQGIISMIKSNSKDTSSIKATSNPLSILGKGSVSYVSLNKVKVTSKDKTMTMMFKRDGYFNWKLYNLLIPTETLLNTAQK